MKNSKGITLITLVITIVILTILTFSVSINIDGYASKRKQTEFETDIISLNEEINQYYAKNKELPIINKYTNISTIQDIKNVNDNENYYVIDLSKLSVDLNYGKDYENVASQNISQEINNILDVYIINEQSHTIYYPKGIEYNNEMHYKAGTFYSEI